MADYDALLEAHSSLPSYSPLLPTSSLKSLSLLFLTATFVLSFYFSILPKSPIKEAGVGAMASLLGGFGLIFAFCAVGVNV